MMSGSEDELGPDAEGLNIEEFEEAANDISDVKDTKVQGQDSQDMSMMMSGSEDELGPDAEGLNFNIEELEEAANDISDVKDTKVQGQDMSMAVCLRSRSPRSPPVCPLNARKIAKARRKKQKLLFRNKVDVIGEAIAIPATPAILAATADGPHLFGGKPVTAGSSTGNRHSVAMKLRLRQIELNSARLMQERKQLEDLKKILIDTRTKLRREGDMLDGMMRHVNTTVLSNMSNEQWKEYFEEHFVVRDDDPSDWEPEDSDVSDKDGEDENAHLPTELDLD